MSFNDTQIAALQAKLDLSHVKKNPKGHDYVEGWHAIAEANRIFGFGEWDRETVDLRLVSERETVIGKGKPWQKAGFAVAYVAKVRITVRAGDTVTVRDGTGYGSGIDADIGAAHEGAAKEAETDAMKRALMTFGNPFGLALYDKARENVERVPEAPPAGPEPRAIPVPVANDKPDWKAFAENVRLALHNAVTVEEVNAWMRKNETPIANLEKDSAAAAKFLRDFADKRRGVLGQDFGARQAAE